MKKIKYKCKKITQILKKNNWKKTNWSQNKYQTLKKQ